MGFSPVGEISRKAGLVVLRKREEGGDLSWRRGLFLVKEGERESYVLAFAPPTMPKVVAWESLNEEVEEEYSAI